jgi:hypothetical protein
MTSSPPRSSRKGSKGGRIVSRLGPHATASLGLDLHRDEDLGRWLVAVCLRGPRTDEAAAAVAFRALAGLGLDTPDAIARAGPEPVARALADAGNKHPERTAAVLARASAALRERHGGSMQKLAGEADGLEDLGGRIAALAPGIGAATVAHYLRALRDLWPAADDLPLAPAARAAAAHLGWLDDGDAEADAAPLRAALANETDAPALVDVEAALTRLGERACLRGRSDRCPLGGECPLRSS